MGLTCMETCEHVGKRYAPCCIAAALPRHRLCCHDVKGRGSLHPPSEPSGRAACRTSDRHTHCPSLTGLFCPLLPLFGWGSFSLTAFSCLFFLFLAHTHAQSVVYFSSCPFCFLPLQVIFISIFY